MSSVAPFREPPWQAGLRGARANLVPGLVLQVVALAVVLAYYHHAPTRGVFEHLLAFRARTGLAFGIMSTGLFGGVLPFFYLRANPLSRSQYGGRQGLLLTVFWGYKGLEIEIWYRLLAYMVGPGHDAATIATKALLDQFVYCPAFAVPLTVLVYKWNAMNFDLRAVGADFRAPGWYVRSVLPTMIANLGVWVPAVAIIYALPTPLQLPLQNLVLFFFTLLLAHLNRRRH
ncbi:MAG TPA: hypothetical protein VLT83_13860 [Opitutaceae bacterium]|nr:hypothetical protein [Opitutaceae bacterium]